MANWAEPAASVFAGLGLLFAGMQVRLSSRQAALERRVALAGVAVTWRALEAPDRSESDGTAEWLYEVVIHNPARLPIDNIEIRWHFPCEVRRIRYTGRLGDPTNTLTFHHPVLAGLDRRAWNRRLKIEFSASQNLKQTWAEVRFRDIENQEHLNRWPRGVK